MGSLLRLYVRVRGSSHIPYGGSPPQNVLGLVSPSLLLPYLCGYESAPARHAAPLAAAAVAEPTRRPASGSSTPSHTATPPRAHSPPRAAWLWHACRGAPQTP